MGREKDARRIILVNRFGPGDRSVTARAAADLADFLRGAGFDCLFICLADAYKRLPPDPAARSAGIPTRRLARLPLPERGPARAAAALLNGTRLSLAALARPSSAVIFLSDPPLLNLCASLLNTFFRRRLVFWTMDLYPEAFAAAGLADNKGFPYKLVSRLVYRRPPAALIALGRRQARHLAARYRRRVPTVIMPCGILPDPGEADPGAQDGRVNFLYAGNLGEAHDEKFLLAFARALDPRKHLLHLAVYGSRAASFSAAAGPLPALNPLPTVPTGRLSAYDIHLVSLRPEWVDVCVPSKAVSAACAGCALLVNAPAASDTWEMLGDGGWLIEPARGKGAYEEKIARFLETLKSPEIRRRKEQARLIAGRLREEQAKARREIAGLLGQAAARD